MPFKLSAILSITAAIFKDRADLVSENLALRHQLSCVRRRGPRPRLRPVDRVFWVLLLVGAYATSERKPGQRIQVPSEGPFLETRAADAKHGAQLAHLSFCISCHGVELEGTLQSESPRLGRLYSSNLTSGAGGIGASYRDADWERAIRHGIGRDGRPLLLMPSHVLNRISDADLLDLIAYLRDLSPVAHQPPPMRLGPLLRVAIGLGLSINMISSRRIDHSTPTRPEFRYRLLTLLAGPPPPSLRSAQGPSSWRPEAFLHATRTGVLPGADTLDPRFMPWLAYRALSDLNLQSIGLYLRKDSSPFEPDQVTGTGQPH